MIRLVVDKVSEQPFENAYARNILIYHMSSFHSWSLCGVVRLSHNYIQFFLNYWSRIENFLSEIPTIILYAKIVGHTFASQLPLLQRVATAISTIVCGPRLKLPYVLPLAKKINEKYFSATIGRDFNVLNKFKDFSFCKSFFG